MAGGAGAGRAYNAGQPQGGTQQPQQQYPILPHQQQGGTYPGKPRSGGYDGPGEPSKRGPNPFAPGPGYDPARPVVVDKRVITNTRVELPASAYRLEGPSVSRLVSLLLG